MYCIVTKPIYNPAVQPFLPTDMTGCTAVQWITLNQSEYQRGVRCLRLTQWRPLSPVTRWRLYCALSSASSRRCRSSPPAYSERARRVRHGTRPPGTACERSCLRAPCPTVRTPAGRGSPRCSSPHLTHAPTNHAHLYHTNEPTDPDILPPLSATKIQSLIQKLGRRKQQ